MASAGCSKSSVTPDPSTPDSYEPSTTPISFQTEYNWGDEEETTRGVIKGGVFEDGDTFGVFAYYNAGGTSATEPNFMNNQEVIYDSGNGSWSYSPIKYWSNNTNDTFDFYAYSPYSASKVVVDSSGEESDTSEDVSADESVDEQETEDVIVVTGNADNPTIKFTPSTDVASQIDLMIAQPNHITNIDKSKEVSFTFKHMLTQIRFSAAHTCANEDAEINILSITLKANPNASGTFDADGNFIWKTYSQQSPEAEYIISRTKNQLISEPIVALTDGTYTDLMPEDGTDGVMLIPQTLIGSEPVIDVVFTYQGTTATVSTLNQSVTFKNSTGLPVGASARFLFEINVDEDEIVSIKGDNIVVEDWVTNELGDYAI